MSAIILSKPSLITERSRLLPPSSSSSSTIDEDSPSDFRRSPAIRHTISTGRFVLICVGIWSANFVFAFQSTAIPTLAPTISSGFNHAELASYLGSVMSLANSAVIPVYGVLMDSLGRKFAMDTACLFFGVGTIACALSRDMYSLIAARAFAGLGGGGLLAVSSVVVTDLVDLRDRGLYQGFMMTIFGAGSMLGGPFSGWLADQYGWQYSFWVQLPLVLFCAIIVTLFVPEAPIGPTHPTLWSGLRNLDWAGSLLLIGGVTTLILGFSFHTSYLEPWSAPIVWGNLLAAVLSFTCLLAVEARVRNPLIPFALFRDRHTAAVLAGGFFLSVVAQAFSFQIPVYFSTIVNSSTAEAGLILSLCGGLGLSIGSLVAGQHIRTGGQYKLLGIISLLPAVVCPLAAAALWQPKWRWWQYYASYFPMPLGYSVFLCVNLVSLISAVDSKMMPRATALLYTVRTLGGTLGISLGGSVQIGVLASELNKRFASLPNRQEIINSILHSKAAIPLLPESLRQLALEAYAKSISIVWVCCGCVAIITVISATLTDERDLDQGSKAKRVVESTGGGAADGELGEGLGRASMIKRATRQSSASP